MHLKYLQTVTYYPGLIELRLDNVTFITFSLVAMESPLFFNFLFETPNI